MPPIPRHRIILKNVLLCVLQWWYIQIRVLCGNNPTQRLRQTRGCVAQSLLVVCDNGSTLLQSLDIRNVQESLQITNSPHDPVRRPQGSHGVLKGPRLVPYNDCEQPYFAAKEKVRLKLNEFTTFQWLNLQLFNLILPTNI